jgi:hypothetical protein
MKTTAYRPGWQSGDGWISQVHVKFISRVRLGRSPPKVLASVVGFSGVVTSWPGDLLEGNISAIDTPVYEDIVPIVWYHRLGVRLLCLWRRRFHDGLLVLVMLGYLHWILHPLRGSILPMVFACWIYLVGSAPVW